MISFSPILALLIAIVQIVFPLLPPSALQASGTIIADGTPSRYQLDLDTSAQEFSLDLETLETELISLQADADGAVQTGLLGEASCTADEALQVIGDSFEAMTGKAIEWNDLRQYLTEGNFLEDIQTVLPYLGGLQNTFPEPEILRENGITYYQLVLDEPQIKTLVSNAVFYLTCPTKASQALETLHIWELVGVEAKTALRYGRMRLDMMQSYISQSVWSWATRNQFSLTLTWSEACATVGEIAVPHSIWAEMNYILYDQNVTWDVYWNDGTLTGTVCFGELQTAAFSIAQSANQTRLNIDYCIYEWDHYTLTLTWSNDDPSSDWNLRLNEYRQSYWKSRDSKPLLYIRGGEQEITFWTYGDNANDTAQGSLYWADGECHLAVQKKVWNRFAAFYIVTADAKYDFGGPLLLNVDWNCDLVNGQSEVLEQYSGTVNYHLASGGGQSMDSFSIRWTDQGEEHTIIGQSQYILNGEGE